jgi:hypothetical protein
MPTNWTDDPKKWAYMWTYVMDGNFHAEHMKMRCPGDDVEIQDGNGYMVTEVPYKAHLRVATEEKDVSVVRHSLTII